MLYQLLIYYPGQPIWPILVMQGLFLPSQKQREVNSIGPVLPYPSQRFPRTSPAINQGMLPRKKVNLPNRDLSFSKHECYKTYPWDDFMPGVSVKE